MNAKQITKVLLEDDEDIDPKALSMRYADEIVAAKTTKLDEVIEQAIQYFEHAVDNIDNCTVKQADEQAAEIGSRVAEENGYKNGSDEFDIIVSAVNNRAGELFPGDWEDDPNYGL